MEKKLDKLNSYLLGAMSSHSYYLVSVIVYILSKLELDDRAMRLLESRHFVANVDSFVMEFAEKDDGSGHRVKNNEHFTNIVYYMLGFFHDHIANNCTCFSPLGHRRGGRARPLHGAALGADVCLRPRHRLAVRGAVLCLPPVL